MKLYYNPASPYVRKVRILAIEIGIEDRIEETEVRMTPTEPDAGLNSDNPIGKVPTLVTDDGHVLFDSRVVCEYLDSLHDGASFFPAPGKARWSALRRQALADGLMDAAVLTRYETFLRPEKLRWPDWIDGQKGKIGRALDAMEQDAGSLADGFDIGPVTFACALGYLDFRYPEDDWRKDRPRLAEWFDAISGRPSVQATMPSGPGTSGPFK